MVFAANLKQLLPREMLDDFDYYHRSRSYSEMTGSIAIWRWDETREKNRGTRCKVGAPAGLSMKKDLQDVVDDKGCFRAMLSFLSSRAAAIVH